MNPFENQKGLNKLALNLAKTQKDYAVFLPSISAIYAKIVSMPEYNVRDKLPEGLINGRMDLDFLNPKNSLFYYPAALYSVGHAYMEIDQSDIYESMVQKRNKDRTIILGDSGGFQIATGVLKWPWAKKKDQEEQDWRRDKDEMRMKILKWLEHTADYSMVLDVPTYGLVKFGFDSHGVSKHPGVKSFNDCLNESLENYAFFIKHRTEGATRFLNVLQGRNQEEGDVWWEAVKDLPFEDWAFSNVQASNFAINLRRLIIMRDEKRLDNVEWLHYLGNGKIKAGCALTTLQRSVRKHINKDITISFDAASPFVMTAKGQMYYGYELSDTNMRFKGGSIVDDKLFKNSKKTINEWVNEVDKKGYVVPTNIGKRCTIGDICVRGYEDLEYKKVPWAKKDMYTEAYMTYLASDEYNKDDKTNEWTEYKIFQSKYIGSDEYRLGDKFKFSSEYIKHLANSDSLFDYSSEFEQDDKKYQVKWPSSMDGFSYLLAMNHNVELHIQAIQEACKYQDSEKTYNRVDGNLIDFKQICEDIFTSQTPMDVIDKNVKLLREITGMDAENGITREAGDFDEEGL